MRRALAVAFVSSTLLAATAAAVDIPISAKSLTIKDATASGGKAKVTFVSRDSSAGISKGSASDLNGIQVSFRLARFNAEGGFDVPAGERLPDASAGWVSNDERGATYVNRDASSGTPTGISKFTITNGKGIKLTGRTIGDPTLQPLTIYWPQAAGLIAIVTVENGAESFRYCTLFPAAEIQFDLSNSGTRSVKAKNGVAHPCPTDPMQFDPLPALPTTPSAPHLWFDGSDPMELAAVQARTSHPDTASLYASIQASVDGALASLGSASDDTRLNVAKGAGVLLVTGAIPPGASGFVSYRDVVVTALSGVANRTATDTIEEFFTPPADVLNVLRDAGRLQSMAEAYDLVRGSGVLPSDDTAMRDQIASWADEYLLDWNLVGDPYGLFEGHRDNWAIKGGSAIVTAALAMPDHPHASEWLSVGVQWINESLAIVGILPGWYAESPHYLNYSMNNLVSAMWHLRNAASTDWFDEFEAFVDVAWAMRQPDGQQPPFEEGVPTTFPWDVVASAYPTRTAELLWALANSPGDPGAYENQQFHVATRFFTKPLDTPPTAPIAAPTQFIDGDTHAVTLRSDWTSGAFQLTGLTAVDTAESESVPSRHHMENPLDVVVHGAGATLLPTASGGSTVTTSPNRSYFLLPTSKNVPLAGENAPYVLEPLAITLGDLIDSRDDIVAHHFVDTATTSVTRYFEGLDVARTVAMVGDSYGVVVDRYAGTGTQSYGTNWRGRGTGTLRAAAADHVAADYDFPSSGAATSHLAIDVTASSPVTGSLTTGYYAPAFGSEETLAPLMARASGTDVTMLTVLQPRPDGAPAPVVAPIAVTDGAAFSITNGATVDVVAAAEEGTAHTAADVVADARLVIVRKVSGSITGIAAVRSTSVTVGATAAIRNVPAGSFAATLAADVVVVTLGSETVAGHVVTLDSLSNIDLNGSLSIHFNDTPVAASELTRVGDVLSVRVPGAGTLRITAP